MRKPEPTLLSTQGIFILPYHISMVWGELAFDDAACYKQRENGFGRLKIPWVCKSVGLAFLLIISYIISLLWYNWNTVLWCKTKSSPYNLWGLINPFMVRCQRTGYFNSNPREELLHACIQWPFLVFQVQYSWDFKLHSLMVFEFLCYCSSLHWPLRQGAI